MKTRTKPASRSAATSSAPPAKRGILDQLLGYQIRRAQTRLFAHFQDHLEDVRITPGQFGLLTLIQENPGITQVSLARAVGIERATLGEFIDRFESERLVERRNVVGDRRSYALHLTKRGADFVASVVPKVLEHEAEFTSHLTAPERNTLLRLLIKLADREDA